MSVYKRGRIYWYEFEFAGSRIRESTRTNSKRVAEEAERKRRRDLELGINRITRPQATPLFKVAAQGVIEDKRRRRARNTGELYKYALKPIVEAFGGKLVCDISPEEIRSYQTRRLATGVSTRTVNIEVGALRTVLKAHRLWAPMSDAVEMLRERKDVGRALSYEDEKRLIEAAGKRESPALLPLLIVTLDTGLRAAEIRALQRKDLALVWKNGVIESGFITVPKSKTEAGTGRTIPLSRRASAALTLWLARFSQTDPDTFVFPRHSVGLIGHKREPHVHRLRLDEPIGEWKKAWKDACTAAGVRYRWHKSPPHVHYPLGRAARGFRTDDHELGRTRLALYARAIQPYSESSEAIGDRSARTRGFSCRFHRRAPTKVPVVHSLTISLPRCPSRYTSLSSSTWL